MRCPYPCAAAARGGARRSAKDCWSYPWPGLSSALRRRSSDVPVKSRKPLGCSDVVPDAAVHFAGDPLARHRLAQERRELSLGTRSDALEELGAIKTDAAEGQLGFAVRVDFGAPQAEVSLRMVRWIRDQNEVREIPSERAADESGEVEIAEDVAVDGDERFGAQKRQRLDDSAGGFERLGLARVADRDAQGAPVAESGLDQVAEMRVIDYDLADTRPRERLDQPGDQSLAPHFDQRLRHRVGEGLHARAAPRGQDHRFHYSKSERVAEAFFFRVELIEQVRERCELSVAPAGAPQIAHHERLILQIAVLAVPVEEPGEDSQHLELALRSHPLEIPVEVGKISGHRQAGLARLLPVTHGPVDDAFLFPGDVGVAQERGEIIGDRAVDRVLKIENTRARLAYHEVARVIIAVHENARLPEVVREERRKSLLQGLALRGAELSLELAGDVPIGKKAQFPLEQLLVVIGQHARPARQLNAQQSLERVAVKPSGVAPVERIQISGAAQIREQQKSAF